MSGFDSLNITPEILYVALAAGAALLAGAGVFLMVRSSRGAEATAPAPKSFPRGTGPKSLPRAPAPKSAPRPTEPQAAAPPEGESSAEADEASAPDTPVDPDEDEDYLREHSMLPYSPEVADGGSDPFHEGGFRERRRAPRRKGNTVDVLLSDDKAEVQPISGIVIDRSTTGLALELYAEGEVEPGTVISVRPRKGSGDLVWTRVVVRRCEKRRSSWILGCQFVRPPSGTAMMDFG